MEESPMIQERRRFWPDYTHLLVRHLPRRQHAFLSPVSLGS